MLEPKWTGKSAGVDSVCPLLPTSVPWISEKFSENRHHEALQKMVPPPRSRLIKIEISIFSHRCHPHPCRSSMILHRGARVDQILAHVLEFQKPWPLSRRAFPMPHMLLVVLCPFPIQAPLRYPSPSPLLNLQNTPPPLSPRGVSVNTTRSSHMTYVNSPGRCTPSTAADVSEFRFWFSAYALAACEECM